MTLGMKIATSGVVVGAIAFFMLPPRLKRLNRAASTLLGVSVAAMWLSMIWGF